MQPKTSKFAELRVYGRRLLQETKESLGTVQMWGTLVASALIAAGAILLRRGQTDLASLIGQGFAFFVVFAFAILLLLVAPLRVSLADQRKIRSLEAEQHPPLIQLRISVGNGPEFDQRRGLAFGSDGITETTPIKLVRIDNSSNQMAHDVVVRLADVTPPIPLQALPVDLPWWHRSENYDLEPGGHGYVVLPAMLPYMPKPSDIPEFRTLTVRAWASNAEVATKRFRAINLAFPHPYIMEEPKQG